MNVIAQLGFEFTYFEAGVEHFSHKGSLNGRLGQDRKEEKQKPYFSFSNLPSSLEILVIINEKK